MTNQKALQKKNMKKKREHYFFFKNLNFSNLIIKTVLIIFIRLVKQDDFVFLQKLLVWMINILQFYEFNEKKEEQEKLLLWQVFIKTSWLTCLISHFLNQNAQYYNLV